MLKPITLSIGLAVAALLGCRAGAPAGASPAALSRPPTAADLHAGHFTAAGRGLLVRHATGDLLLTRDAGATWQRGADLPDQYLEAAWLFDDGRVVLGGERGLHESRDGGRTVRPVAESAGLSIYSLHFPTTRRGFAAGFTAGGTDGAILRSDDGGLTSRRLGGAPAGMVAAIHFASGEIGVVAAGRDLARTRDGRASWTVVARDLGRTRSIHRAPGGRWWAVGHDGMMATSDDGITWAAPASPRPRQLLRDVWFADANNGWLAGDAAPGAAPLWRTRDGGRTWKADTAVRFDVHQLVPRTGGVVAVGDGGAAVQLGR